MRVDLPILMALAFAMACERPLPAPPPPPAAVLAAPLVTPLTAAPPEAPGGGRHVVLISIDGMRPDYYLRADAYHLAIPNLRSIMQRGRVADGVIGTWPTVTYPAHTTLVTGARPSAHGILANRPFDPMYQNQSGWNWYAESIQADTLWAALRRAGKTSASDYWPVTVGASIDDNFPQIWRAKVDEDDKLLRALIVGDLAVTYQREYGALPAEHRSDHERGNAAELLVRERRRDLTLVYFTDLDEAQHVYGPATPRVFRTLERIDAEVGRVLRGIEAAGDAARTAVIVVSDHGFAPVKKEIHAAAILREAGLLEVGFGTVKRWQAGVLAAGGMAGIYLKEPSDPEGRERLHEVLVTAASDPAMGIRAVDGPEVSQREGGFTGASYVLEAAPGFEFDASFALPVVVPSGDKGAHGYSPKNEEMHASLLAAGAGIKQGPPLHDVSMLGIAPTVARLLGVKLKNAEAPPIEGLLDTPDGGEPP
jgi:predicted AlkP superfamily pyrophosphatase or phosphodiesterase